jgi:hypothetical protein
VSIHAGTAALIGANSYVITPGVVILMHINELFALQQYPCLIRTTNEGVKR